MELFLGFAPFIAFVFVANHVSPNLALLVGAFVAVGLVVRRPPAPIANRSRLFMFGLAPFKCFSALRTI